MFTIYANRYALLCCGGSWDPLDHPGTNGFVGKGSDHLQLIKFWPSCARREAGLRRVEIFFCSALLQPAHTACVSSEHFFFNLIEGLHERTEYIDIFLFSAHHSVVFCFQCSVYWW